MEYLIGAVILAGSIPLFYWHEKGAAAAIAFERAQYDDSECPPGFTNYPGPM